ncbi:MAG: hypothetical protein A4E53_01516 [Pelotomaculum sp. PtaB.Bin104]|nr:MAG: hypothetical protein A4E53_01516 [Pelotomaculum sp. PtaB.Bin104]
MFFGGTIILKNTVLGRLLRGDSVSNAVVLKIKYLGQVYQMDVDTLVVSLLNFAEMLKAVGKKTVPGEEFQLKIDATEKGSFVVVLEIVKKAAGNLLDLFASPQTTLDSLSKIIAIVVNIMNLKKFLKGEKPEQVTVQDGNVIVVKDGGQIIVAENVYKIYAENSEINHQMEKSYEKLSDNPEIEGVVFENENNVFVAGRADLFNMARENQLIAEQEIKELKRDVRLSIVKIVFQKNRKWEFVYEGSKISAYMADDTFWRLIDEGRLRFSKGDVIVADLEITKVFEPELNCHVNKGFRVVSFVGHERPATYQQESFFLE